MCFSSEEALPWTPLLLGYLFAWFPWDLEALDVLLNLKSTEQFILYMGEEKIDSHTNACGTWPFDTPG